MKRNREMIDLTPFTDKQKEKTYRTNETERQTDEGKKKIQAGRGGQDKPSEEQHNLLFNYKHWSLATSFTTAF